MKIGVLVTSSFTTEVLKFEYFRIDAPKRPWLKETPAKIRFKYHDKDWKSQAECVTSDGAIVSYLKWKIKSGVNVHVEAVFPKELTRHSARQFDLIFCPMVDILEYATIAPLHEQQRFKNVLQNIPNIYPSFQVQKLINDKAAYHSFFTKRRIPMIDTISFQKKDVSSPQQLKRTIAKIKRRSRTHKWLRIVVKPNSGQEGIGFSALPENVDDDRLANVLQDVLATFDSVLVQEYIPGFDKRTMEHRLYTINDKYCYTVITQRSLERPRWVKEEGGDVKSKWFKDAKKLAAKVCRLMPKTVINGIKLPNMLMRSDIGYRLTGKGTALFLSEQEFVPSLYARECPKGIFPEQLVGDAIIKIARVYQSQQKSSKSNRSRM